VGLYLYALGEEETPERLQAALRDAGRAVERAPGDGRARAALALALAHDNRLARAEEEARRAAALPPPSAEIEVVLSQVLRLRGDSDGALAAARRAADLEPADPRPLVALGEALREQDRLFSAMEMFGQAVDLDHEAVVPQLAAAAVLVKSGRMAMARNAYNHLLDNWDYGTRRALLGASALLVALQNYEGALDMYARLPVPDNAAHTTLLALYGRAYALLRLGRDAEAEYFLSNLVTRVPADWDGPARAREILYLAYDDLVGFFAARGRDDRVESLLRAAADRPLAPSRMARALAGRLGTEKDGRGARRDGREAVGILARSILSGDPREDPIEVADTALLLARVASRGGARRLPPDSEAARALALAAERVAPSPYGAAHYRMARARALAGEPDAAIDSLRRARDTGYLPEEAAASEPDFARLRERPAFRDLLGARGD
jgi:tetratricopeptide (TPR) repeat protein